ncbi:MAG: S28 family serine protease [Polyangia bacterium]
MQKPRSFASKRSRPTAWLLSLAALALTLAACPEPVQEALIAAPDATADLASPPDLAPPVDLVPEPDILDLLRRVPGLSVTEKPTSLTDYRFFQLELEQPVDHARPDGPRFKQRLSLLHRGLRAPVVLHGSGYGASFFSRSGRAELTALLSANQIDFEHRYFLPSRPEPADFRYLTIQQAAADSHRIVQIFRAIYRGRFLNTGASKGGMTAVYHRRFFPADVDATVAYVAPHSLGAPDPRYVPFVNQAGTDPDCRKRLRDYQRTVLTRRTAVVAALGASGATFTRLGIDKALEHSVLELPFGFWQYRAQADCAKIPDPAASDEQVLKFLSDVGSIALYSDQGIAGFEPYYFQAASQLGFPATEEAHLADLLRHPGTDRPDEYLPTELRAGAAYDATAMPDISAWLQSDGERILFIYGSNDPWSAGAFELGLARDSYRLTVPGGNHGSRVGLLPEPLRTKAMALLRRWADVSEPAPQPLAPALSDEELRLQGLWAGEAGARRERPL